MLLNSYGPNLDDPQFYPRLQSMIGSEIDYPLIWLGDFNCIIDGLQDRHPSKLGTKPKMTQSLDAAMSNLGLIDTWRHTHPALPEYTCYTPTHGTYSRLDRILLSEDKLIALASVAHMAR